MRPPRGQEREGKRPSFWISRYLGFASTFRLSQGYAAKGGSKRSQHTRERRKKKKEGGEEGNERRRHQPKVRPKAAKSEEKGG